MGVRLLTLLEEQLRLNLHVLELDHPFHQRLIEWQERILEEIKELQEGKKALAAYKPSGDLPPRLFDRKV